MTVSCRFCGELVDPDGHFVWRRVVGWEKKAVGGARRGGSDIVLREKLEEFACGHCIDRQKRGLAASQGALL